MLSSRKREGSTIGLPEPEQIGKYRIVAKIGQGAMGTVYKAEDLALKRFVAIKTIRSTGLGDDLEKRFLREAQSAARLNHPNIVTVFDFGEDRGRLYMAMELLEGRDLKEHIKARLLPDLDAKLRVAAEICDGLAFAHARGIVHRDLKPANIQILPSGQVKIMDFGLARLSTSDMTKSGMILGTPNYMAPEQVRGEKADARSDVFSLGAVFYELLVGRKAFDAESMHSVLLQVLQEDPAPVPDVMPGVPQPVAELVETALRKDPAERYADAGEMAEAVRAVRDSLAAESPELLGAVAEGEAVRQRNEAPTMMELDPSVARRRETAVAGATALKPRPSGAPAGPGFPTLSGKTPTHPPSRDAVRAAPSRMPLVAGLLLAVAGAVGGLVYWNAARPSAPVWLAPADLAREQEGILKEALLDNQLELAHLDFENKSYQGAIAQAEKLLAIEPGNAEAIQIRDRARTVLVELEATAEQARGAFAKGDPEAASRALTRVLSLDPRHPVAAELSAKLNRFFRAQAEFARKDAVLSRTAADAVKGAGQPDYAAAEAAARQANALLGREEYAVATQKFMEARDAYEKARRTAEAAARTPVPKPVAPTASAAQRPLPPPSLPPAATLPPATVAPASAASAPGVEPTAVSSNAAHEEAIRRVLSDYGRAIASKDLELFRKVKPNLSKDEQKRLADAFKAVKTQDVGITVDSMAFEGSEAVVRVSRQDTINGARMKVVRQTLHFARSGDSWTIQSIGQ